MDITAIQEKCVHGQVASGIWGPNSYKRDHFDMVVLDEASLISPHTFSLVASTLNLLNSRPVVLIAGDKLSAATTADGGQQGLQHHVHPQ